MYYDVDFLMRDLTAVKCDLGFSRLPHLGERIMSPTQLVIYCAHDTGNDEFADATVDELAEFLRDYNQHWCDDDRLWAIDLADVDWNHVAAELLEAA